MLLNRDNSKQSGTVVLTNLPHFQYCISYCDFSCVSRALQLVKIPLVLWLYSLVDCRWASTLWGIVRHLSNIASFCASLKYNTSYYAKTLSCNRTSRIWENCRFESAISWFDSFVQSFAKIEWITKLNLQVFQHTLYYYAPNVKKLVNNISAKTSRFFKIATKLIHRIPVEQMLQ